MKARACPTPSVITVAGNGSAEFLYRLQKHQIGDPFIFKSDFVKLRNISLAYNFTDLIKKVDF